MVPNASSGASGDAPGRAPYPPVMVVEDDESLRELLAQYLGREGYPVEQAADGVAALRALERRGALGAPPGLVLLDLMLPRISGLDVLAHLNAAGVDVPVVVMSVYDHLLIKAAAGAQGVLIKPFDLEQLLPVVARYCEAAGGDARPAPRPPQRI